MQSLIAPALVPAFSILMGFAASSVNAQTAPPQASSPYTLTVFAAAPPNLTAPDSIAVVHDHVFVGYGDGHAPDGSDGKNSQVVEFSMDGTVEHIYTVPGHSDGLKLDPITGRLWALQNEDASPNLVIIDTETQQQKLYQFAGMPPHGGGYDDIVFRGCKVYISASNPARNPNTGPAIVSAHLRDGAVQVKPVLMGNASAIDVLTGGTVTLNLQDPDSMTLDPLGNIVLDSQADQELIYVTHPGEPNQQAVRLPLSWVSPKGPAAVEVDDTAFVTSSQGFILFADKGLNMVFKLTRPGFVPGSAYTAADGGPFVGALDLTSGVITPVVNGVANPGGLVYVDTSRHDDDSGNDGSSDRQDRDHRDRDAERCDRDDGR
ncbi:MAG TPA: hypothetical protein VHS76_03885 [Steroidobacteraceae bacterium]|nr:hypothetical protein [Steroidobacteraceae bacterium]